MGSWFLPWAHLSMLQIGVQFKLRLERVFVF
jgi:hypothetical protein